MRILAVVLLIIGIGFGYFAYPFLGIHERIDIPYRLGLDLAGGVHLVYNIDTTTVSEGGRSEALEGLRDAIERRVNLFGVSEPLVQIASREGNERLIVELAGVFDTREAVELIGDTPFLEFRSPIVSEEGIEIEGQVIPEGSVIDFAPTPLNGQYLERAEIQFDQITGSPIVGLVFNDEGADLFEELTTEYLGQQIAIYLDGVPLSAPVVQQPISGGRAQISGDFTPEEARLLVQRLNAGALPLEIELVSQQSVEASLGEQSLNQTFFAGIVGLVLVAIFMILWYRIPGVVAVLALGIYIAMMLALFKIIPVTLSAAAITGFILSLGMAVDANILIFERMKEELRSGKTVGGSLEQGFDRAWTSIRDSNISSLITAIILWWFGTSIVKGFALTLGIGVLLSMFSAITVSRTFLRVVSTNEHPVIRALMHSGFHK